MLGGFHDRPCLFRCAALDVRRDAVPAGGIVNHRAVTERLLEQMRESLADAAEMERLGFDEVAQAYGAMAANKLAQAVARQYHVIDLGL